MTFPAVVARASVALAVLAATPAAEAEAPAPPPDRPCADRASVVERLESRFGETRQSMGLNRANGVVEVFASPETGTWTILITKPDGQSCLIASGDMWEPNAKLLVRGGQDA